jgi:hypothetical protein
MKRAITVFCLAAGLVALSAPSVFAGYKRSWPVYVNTSSRVAYGALGDARASSDSTQYIDCYVIYSNGSPFAACEARSSTNTFGICSFSSSTTNAAIQIIATQTASSSYYFTWDANGNCTYLNVANGSFDTPKVP